MINNRIGTFRLYPFERLGRMLEGVQPPAGLREINMGIGEPQHPAPPLVREVIDRSADLWGKYPPMLGTPEFRRAAAGWLGRRFGLPDGMIEPDRHIVPVSGTREALFMAGLTAIPETKNGKRPVVLIPDPFYQVYVGAGVFAGAEPYYLPCTAQSGYLPDFAAVPQDILERTALAFLCSPSNPQGAAANIASLRDLIGLARRFDFVVALDECYCELYYTDQPVAGGLQACAAMGGDMSNVLTFHSLSKRSSVPGLRSGFVAGAADLTDAFWRVRLYGGAAPSLAVLAASTALWNDDAYPTHNRALYARKFDLAERILQGRLGFYRPDGGFYLWLEVEDGEAAARRLWAEAAIRVQPGAFFAHDYPDGTNVGRRYIRAALVHDLATVEEALHRIRQVL
ncbi:MAG: aminotransferase class I/II-fold pyridoxal phosphate-dependent enzyme [Alphaproteobacteria bacterium]